MVVPKETSDSRRTTALAVAGAIGGTAVLCTVLSAPFIVIPAFRRLGAIPWMVTPIHITKQAISKLVQHQLARSSSIASSSVGAGLRGKTFIDLGSGDGRVVIAAAQAGYTATGIELNPVLITMSYIAAWRAGVLSLVRFRMQNFWSINLKEYDAISIFGVNPVMEKLHEKLDKEAQPGTHVVCFRFPMKRRKPLWQDNELYLYEIE